MVYVDNYQARLGRMKMCHMIADTLPELHRFAAKLGLKPEWFQDRRIPHYDLCLTTRRRALVLGAVEVGSRELIKLARRA